LGELGKGRPVVFYDQLGAGRSTRTTDTTLFTVDHYKNELDILIKHLGLQKVNLYGHSWGAIPAVEYSLSNPSMINSLILASPVLDNPRWISDVDSLLRTMPDSISGSIRKNETAGIYDSPDYLQAVTQFNQLYVSRKVPWSADMESTLAEANFAISDYMIGPAQILICSGTLKNYNITPRLGEIKSPTLYIMGEYDLVLPQTLMYFKSLTPNSEIVITENAAHLTMIDNTSAYIESLKDFLERADRKK
jgi:proline iminopeptidase